MKRLEKLIESYSHLEENIFSLYDGDGYPNTIKANAEIKAVADQIAKDPRLDLSMDLFDDNAKLDAVVTKWKRYGARDTASMEDILDYIKKKAK